MKEEIMKGNYLFFIEENIHIFHSFREEEGAIGYDNYYMEPGGTNESRENENAKKLNSLKPENFPSLGNGVQIPNTTSSVTFTSKFTPTSFSGEDFPTLGILKTFLHLLLILHGVNDYHLTSLLDCSWKIIKSCFYSIISMLV